LAQALPNQVCQLLENFPKADAQQQSHHQKHKNKNNDDQGAQQIIAFLREDII
jgi:hypothetical protein